MRKILVGATLVAFFVVVSPASAQTGTALQAELDLLLRQLAALQAELQGRIATQGNPAATGSVSLGSYGSCPSLSRSLRRDTSGQDVAALQQFLAGNRSTYPEGIVSGYFGAFTEAAVQRFQAEQRIADHGTPDSTGYGVVGPATRDAIARVCGGVRYGGGGGGGYPPPVVGPGGNCIFMGGQVAPGVLQTFYSVASAPQGTQCAQYALVRQCLNGAFSGDPRYQYAVCTNPGRPCLLDGVTVPHNGLYTFFARREVRMNESCTPYSQQRICNDGMLSGSSAYQFSTCAASTTPSGCTLDGIALPHGQSRTFYKEKTVLFGQTCAPFGKLRSCTQGVLGGDAAYQYASCTISSGASCTVGTTTIAHGLTKDFFTRTSVSYQESCATYGQSRRCTDGVISGNTAYEFPICTQVQARTCTVDGAEVAHSASRTFYTTGVSSNCASVAQSRTCTDGSLSGSSQYQVAECAPVGQRWCKQDGVYVKHNLSRTFYTAPTTPFGQSCANISQSRTCADGSLQGSSAYAYATCTSTAAATCMLDGVAIGHNQSYGFYSRQSVSTGDTCEAYKQMRTCFDGALSGNGSFQYRTCTNS